MKRSEKPWIVVRISDNAVMDRSSTEQQAKRIVAKFHRGHRGLPFVKIMKAEDLKK